MDLATSTNDALFFIVWHANMMRHFVRWQQLALAKDPQMAERAYGYPTSRDDYSALNEGAALHDTINSKLPFKSGVFPMPPSNPGTLCGLEPGASIHEHTFGYSRARDPWQNRRVHSL